MDKIQKQANVEANNVVNQSDQQSRASDGQNGSAAPLVGDKVGNDMPKVKPSKKRDLKEMLNNGGNHGVSDQAQSQQSLLSPRPDQNLTDDQQKQLTNITNQDAELSQMKQMNQFEPKEKKFKVDMHSNNLKRELNPEENIQNSAASATEKQSQIRVEQDELDRLLSKVKKVENQQDLYQINISGVSQEKADNEINNRENKLGYANLKINGKKKDESNINMNQDNSASASIPIDFDNFQMPLESKIKDLKDDTLKHQIAMADMLLDNQVSNDISKKQMLSGKPTSDDENRILRYTCDVINLEHHKPLLINRLSLGHVDNQDLIQLFYPYKYAEGTKIKDQFHCNQQMFTRRQPDGRVKALWVLHNIGSEHFFNRPDPEYIKHYIQSGVFQTIDGMMWRLRLQPGIWPNLGQNGLEMQRPSPSQMCLYAMASPEERKNKRLQRKVNVQLSIYQPTNGQKQSIKDWRQTIDFDAKLNQNEAGNNCEQGISSYTFTKFSMFQSPKNMRQSGTSEQQLIEIEIEHLLPDPAGPGNGKQNQDKEDGQLSLVRQNRQPQFKGLVNEGQTCYINSLMQTLFFIRTLRNAVYKMPSIQLPNSDCNSIPFCMQRIFWNLQLGQASNVRTHELLQAFGWKNNEQYQQQDVNEFNCVLSDQLERQMENTEVEGTYKSLFEGKYQTVIQCLHVDYESTKDELFSTINLSVKGNDTIEDSIRQYIASESLDGDNKYDTSTYGKQDARKFVRFIELPPVLQISLNRYDYDPNIQAMAKNNQKFEFKDILDLESVLPKESNQSSQNQINRLSQRTSSQICSQKNEKVVNRYHLHSILIHRGTVDFGHYYAFIRPHLDDRWYEFNDICVQEVTKNQAFRQGIGGDYCEFEYVKYGHQEHVQSSGQLFEKFEENKTNAYMLIYVRETERESIMTDQLSVDEQIPKELQIHFKIEESYRSQMQEDNDAYKKFKKCYLITEETILNNHWDGPLVAQQFKNHSTPNGYNFETKASSHHLIYVNQHISINEFIIMIKDRFFKNIENIDLEDIWIYRIIQQKINNSDVQHKQNLHKLTYDIKERYDCPLLTGRVQNKTEQWVGVDFKKKWGQLILDSIYIYIVINPTKINQRTGKPYQVLRKLTEQDRQAQTQHYDEFIEYINKSGTHNGGSYIHMYEKFKTREYRFAQLDGVLDHEMKDQSQDRNSDMNPDQPEQISSLVEDPRHHQAKDKSQFSIGMIKEKNTQNLNYRKHFIFNYDSDLEKNQEKLHNEAMNQQQEENQRKHLSQQHQTNQACKDDQNHQANQNRNEHVIADVGKVLSNDDIDQKQPVLENADVNVKVDEINSNGQKRFKEEAKTVEPPTGWANQSSDETSEARSQERFLCFVKVMDNRRRVFRQAGHVFLRETQKFDLNILLQKAANLLVNDKQNLLLQNLSVFVEPSSNFALRLQPAQTVRNQNGQSDNGQEKSSSDDELQGRGLLLISHDITNFYALSTDLLSQSQHNDEQEIDGIEVGKFIQKNGCCFVICLKDEYIMEKCKGKINHHTLENQIRQHYLSTYHSLSNRAYFNLCQISDDDISLSGMQQNVIGVYEFNQQHSYNQIAYRVAHYYSEATGHKVSRNYIQFFNSEFGIVSVNDVIKRRELSDEGIPLLYLATHQMYINFMILNQPFENADRIAEVKFKVFMHDDIYCKDNRPYFRLFMDRQANMRDLIQRYKWELHAAQENNSGHPDPSSQQNNNQNDVLYLAMVIDRETGTVKRVLESTVLLQELVGGRNSLSFNNLPEVFRLQQLSGQDVMMIRRIYNQNSQRDVCFAFLQLYDKFGQRLGEEFFTPFSYRNTTFRDLYDSISQKLLAIKHKPNNRLCDFDHKNFILSPVSFLHNVQKSRGGRIIWQKGDLNYKNPRKIQIDINEYGHVEVGQIVINEDNIQKFDMNNSLYKFTHFMVQIDAERLEVQQNLPEEPEPPASPSGAGAEQAPSGVQETAATAAEGSSAAGAATTDHHNTDINETN